MNNNKDETRMTTVPFMGPGFRLDVPSTWTVFASGGAQASFLMPPYDSNRAMTVLVQLSQVVDSTTSERAAAAALSAQTENYPGFQHLSTEVSPHPPTRIIQRVRWQPPQGEAVVQHNLFCVADGHLIFALTATRPEALPADQAAAWDAEVDSALRTFTPQTPLPI